MNTVNNDILWILFCAVLVMVMQAGFLCLESGATRSKNSINVAMKNAADLIMSIFVFWLVGFGFMFGSSPSGWIGSTLFAPDLSLVDLRVAAIFLYQSMFCATAATIISGAIAERTRFNAYLAIGLLTVLVIYPIAGHWSWGSAVSGTAGWLERQGFIDFAGSTVVHSVGGWVALAAIIIIGPRYGRFDQQGVVAIPGSNLPLAMLGVILFQVGWVGFNGGSALALTAEVPGIIINTVLAGVSGGVTAYLASRINPQPGADMTMLPLNGLLAGMVAVTANCQMVTTGEAVLIAAIGSLLMLMADRLMVFFRLDDAIGAVPVHLAAGIWGTLAVALFGDSDFFAEGVSRMDQLEIQFLGILVYGLWSFGLAYLVLSGINRIKPLRVSSEQEQIGLNVSEHDARTELVELLDMMDSQREKGDLSMRAPVEPFTEVGQIAKAYNLVIDSLEAALAQTSDIVRDIRDGIITFNADGRLTSFNPGAEKLFATSSGQVLGRHVTDLIVPDQYHHVFSGHEEYSGENFWRSIDRKQELRAKRADASEFDIELTVSKSPSLNKFHYTGVIRDVTERKRFEDQLFQEKELAQTTLASIAEGVITTDREGRVRYLNQTASELTGWSSGEAAGRLLRDVYCLIDETSGEESIDVATQILSQSYSIAVSIPQILNGHHGKQFSVEHTAAPIRNARGDCVGVVVVFRDVTQTRELQKQLSFQATHDSLTGLMNRSAFEARLAEVINNARIEQSHHVLCFLDLDQFKLVNDTCGHVAGDELLRQLSQLLGTKMRSGDVLARLGGDEFGLLLYGCPIEQGERIAEEFRSTIYDFRFPWDDRQFAVGVSIGLVPVSRDTESLGSLLSLADAACYAAKDKGRNRVHVYEPDDMEVAQKRGQMQWVTRIREALDRDQMRLYFQRIVPTVTSEANYSHFEIFVRMLDEDGSVIPPGAFIPAAERFGQIVDLDRWIIRNALAWLGDHYRRSPETELMCSLNLSGQSLSDRNFLDEIKTYFDKYDLPSSLVCFEITETAAVADLKTATAFIRDLKATGCRFALDDFGSGLSSFGYLKNLPVDYVKIDGAFVQHIDTNDVDRAMVESIHSIVSVMGLKTIAEFVENEASLNILREIGIDLVQGHYIDKPRPLEQMEGVKFMPR